LTLLVDDFENRLTKEQTERHLAAMDRRPHKRPDPRPPLAELIRLRQKHYPDMMQRDFAALLGITRLHMTSIEKGRRTPSILLALRWLALLAPEARLEMFGPLPVVEDRVRALKRLQEVSPEIFKAA
jgi:DNA-binding XRE family transcriptional regulator